MAIVFVSPKEKQNRFFKVTIIVLIFFFVVAILLYALFKFKNEIQGISSASGVSDANISIDFSVIDSPEIKNLDPFDSAVTEFSYIAQDGKGKKITGLISAKDKGTAEQLLLLQGITFTSLEEAIVGRSDPFASYYQIKK